MSISKQLNQLASQNGWKKNEKEATVFGDYNGYLFTALEGKGFKTFITPVAGISPDSLASMTRFLNEHRRQLQLLNFEFSDNFLCLRQKQKLLPLSVDKMESLLGQVSGLLDLYELPVDACAVCGRKAESKGLYFGLLCHMHPACESAELTDYTRPASQDDSQEPSQEEAVSHD